MDNFVSLVLINPQPQIMKRINLITVLTLACTLSILLQCSSPEPPDMGQVLEKYILGYTSGVVPRSTDIKITLNDQASKERVLNEEIDASFLKIDPSVKGTLRWTQNNTLVFTPSELLPVDTEFNARLSLKDILSVEKSEEAYFYFTFQTRPQDINIQLESFHLTQPLESDLVETVIQIQLADVATPEEVKEMIEISHQDKPMEIEWLQTQTSSTFPVRVSNIKRGEAESELVVNWDGKGISYNEKGTEVFKIPAKGDFSVYSVQVQPEDENHLFITFTDHLDDNQSLQGLIQIEGYQGEYRFTRDENTVRLYHNESLNGDYKISFSKSIKNHKGKALDYQTLHEVSFSPPKPAVKIVGRGHIVPAVDNKFILPIEAVNLHSIDVEIFKIFSNNTLQYFQMDEWEADYNMVRVGRLIKQETVKLQASSIDRKSRTWQRYGIDLSEMLAKDPDAIYQVRIGFRPEHVTMACADALTTSHPANLKDQPELISFYDNYTGWATYEDEYEWSNRDNPCAIEYYNKDHFVSRTLLTSDLGLIVKKTSTDTWMLLASRLSDASPESGVKVTFYDFQQQAIETKTTDQDGMVELQTSREPYVVIAEKGNIKSYIKVDEAGSLQLSRFDVSGTKPQKGMKGMIYGEREVWRPGDSLHLHFILEKQHPDEDIPPVTCELKDPNGQVIQRYPARLQVGSIYDIGTKTNADAITGDYLITVRVGGAKFYKYIKVESIKPNRLKIDYKNTASQVFANNRRILGTLKSAWLHGAVANGLKATIDVEQANDGSGFEKYGSFSFSDPSRIKEATSVRIFDGKLDATGKAIVDYKLQSHEQLPGKQILRLKTTVHERGGDFSIDYQALKYSPFRTYAGISIPKDRYGQNRLDLGEPTQVSLIVVDEKGKPVANQKIDIGIYEVAWRWWWDSYDDYTQSFNSNDHHNALYTMSVVTDASGSANINPNIPSWGRYLFRACLTESGHCSGDFAYVGYPYYDDETLVMDESTLLSIQSDKEKYAPGEDIEISIPSANKGRALLSLENGSSIVHTQWYDIQAGQNTIRFKAEANMAPNVYANIMLLQPQETMTTDQPLRMYGLIPLLIEDPDTRLKPAIKMPNELEGEKKFTVEISEEDGREMSYTLAIVDDGLLDLTRFETPDPHGSFFAKEALGVWTWDYYDRVLSKFSGGTGRLLSIGGDASVRVEGTPTPNRFPPVVMNAGPFKLAKGKKAKHEFTMPNYAGSVRVMVVAADHKKYGHADKTVKVSKPLMVFATLPRVLGPGESIMMPINLFSLEKKIKKATVQVKEDSGLATFPEGTSATVNFDESGEEIVYIPVKMKEQTGTAKFHVEVKGDGQEATYQATILVRNANPVENLVKETTIASGQNGSLTMGKKGYDGGQSALIQVSSLPPINLAKQLQYLIGYPHGCLEQTLSKAFPQLFMADVFELTSDQMRLIPYYVQEGIRRIQQNIRSDGSLGNWPGSDYDSWISTYTYHFLTQAQSKGYVVSTDLLAKVQRAESSRSKAWKPLSGTDKPFDTYERFLQQTYRLFVLAKAGNPDLASMNILREHKGLESTPAYLLAGAYALAGRIDAAENILSKSKLTFQTYAYAGRNYGSSIRDKSLALQALTAVGKEGEMTRLLKEIIDEVNASEWHSTQTISHAMCAISTVYKKQKTTKPLSFIYNLNKGKEIAVQSNKTSILIELPKASLSAGIDLTFTNRTDGVLYAKLVTTVSPPPGEESIRANNLGLRVQYQSLEGAPLDVTSLAQGQDFFALVTVSRGGLNYMRYQNLALTQIFPSGWEISNDRIAQNNQYKNGLNIDYQDIRDDRVLTYFDLQRKNTLSFKIPLKATYTGRYYMPSHLCEGMYNNDIQAGIAGKWVEVRAQEAL